MIDTATLSEPTSRCCSRLTFTVVQKATVVPLNKIRKIYSFAHCTQGHSMRIFVRKMPQRCGVWQIKPMTSPDLDPLSTKSNSSGFGSYSQMKF